MSTQYNTLQGPYDEMRKTTIAIVERVNVREIVLPFVQGSTVLDLACGSGFYSRAFLEWRAEKVVGVDISSAMLKQARVLSRDYGDAINFIEADCSKPASSSDGPFDLVFGAWFLNYAPNGTDMIEMYRNIQLNLKPEVRYVGVTPPPTNDPRGLIERECLIRPWPTASGGLYSTVNRDVDEGVSMHLHKDTAAGNLDFDCYHLKVDVWEAAAREAGFTKAVTWTTTKIPHDFMANPEHFGEQVNGGADSAELQTYEELPHYGILVVEK